MRIRLFLLLALLAVEATAQARVATARVEGRVVDMRGQPVPSARVWATHWSEPERPLVQTATDAEGWFVLGKVPVGGEPWGIRATATGRAVARVRAVASPEPVHVQLPDAAYVKGVVVNGKGEPVPGVMVAAGLAFTSELRGVRDLAFTDAQGRFEMGKVPLGLVWLTAVVPGEGMAGARQHVTGECSVTLAPAPWTTMNATLEVRGLPQGGPPAGAFVLFETQAVIGLPPPWDRVPLDRTGRAELRGVPAWICTVTPRIPGYVCRPQSANLDASQPGLVFEAVAPPEVLVPWQGVLRDVTGAAAPGVILEARISDVQRYTAQTDGEGRWQFDLPFPIGTAVTVRCHPGDWVLDWAAPGQIHDMVLGPVFHGHVAQVTKAQLRAIPAGTVAGRVLLADGSPAARVIVVLEEELGTRTRWRSEAVMVTDLTGNYRFSGVHPRKRRMRIAVDGPLGAGVSEPLWPMRPETFTVPDLTLRPPGVVEGVLVDAAGKPAVGWHVWLRMSDELNATEVFSDQAGRFRFPSVRGGDVKLLVGLDNKQVEVEAFTLTAGATRSSRLTVPGK